MRSPQKSELFPVAVNLSQWMTSSPATLAGHSLIFYDGVCGLCNRFVRFVLRHDFEDQYRFCALQDPLASQILARYGLDPATLNTVCLVINPFASGERLLLRSDAAIALLSNLNGGWRLLARILALVPRRLRDFAYGIVARIRYRLFGRLAVCPLPTPAERHRFVFSP